MFALRQQLSELGILELELDVLVEIILDLGVDALPELADRSLVYSRSVYPRSWSASSGWRPRRNETAAMARIFNEGCDSFATGTSSRRQQIVPAATAKSGFDPTEHAGYSRSGFRGAARPLEPP